MSIFQGIDQLHIHHDPITFPPHTSFQNIGDSEELADFTQIVRRGIAELHHR